MAAPTDPLSREAQLSLDRARDLHHSLAIWLGHAERNRHSDGGAAWEALCLSRELEAEVRELYRLTRTPKA